MDTYETEKTRPQVGKREASKAGKVKSDTYETEKICPPVGKREQERRAR